jgi:hypothetical protein
MNIHDDQVAPNAAMVAFQEGSAAYDLGVDPGANPYEEESDEWVQWREGMAEAAEEADDIDVLRELRP